MCAIRTEKEVQAEAVVATAHQQPLTPSEAAEDYRVAVLEWCTDYFNRIVADAHSSRRTARNAAFREVVYAYDGFNSQLMSMCALAALAMSLSPAVSKEYTSRQLLSGLMTRMGIDVEAIREMDGTTGAGKAKGKGKHKPHYQHVYRVRRDNVQDELKREVLLFQWTQAVMSLKVVEKV